MASTTIQVDVDTHARLAELKEAAGADLTFDAVIRLLLDLATPEEVAAAERAREEAYREWQREFAGKIRKSKKTYRIA